jgi:pyrroloquinoline quinone biosynthesis protein B
VIIRVLGSAAGGGFPQWNCGCPNCRDLRAGTIRARARTQECVAVSGDGASWYLLNCSPEVRAQIEGFPPLWPREPRDSPIAGILLTNGDLDHTLGLLSLREGQRLHVHATDAVRRGFVEGNVLARTLERFPGQLTWHALELDREVDLDATLRVRAVAVPGKVPLHLEGSATPDPSDNIGLLVRDRSSGRTLAYFSAVARVTPTVASILAAADCVFFDGTFFREDELVRLGLGVRRAAEMAHLPVADSLAALAGVRARRRIFIHVNNTNPILREDSPERATVAEAGWEVAEDGQEVQL